MRNTDGSFGTVGESLVNVGNTSGVGGVRFSVGTTAGSSATNANLIQPANLWADGRRVQLASTTISELRTLIQVQKLYERDARGGTRYVESVKAHFGVEVADYRLQRPEFLGDANCYVGMQQVPQMSSTDTTTPQGNMAAYSYTSDSHNLFSKTFTEHGFLHIFVHARHPKTYQQGLEKLWSRRERLDYYFPVFANISEQPIQNMEIFAGLNLITNREVFGYNEAWIEYRSKPNRVTGQMRSGVTNSLDFTHYADHYSSLPHLSAGWMEDNSNVNVDRTIALSERIHDQIIMDIAFKCKATRPMPLHSIPGYVDHN